MTASELTERQRYWFDHLKTAEQRDITLVRYAAEQGLKAKDLYNWRSRFIKRGLLSSSQSLQDFVPVRMDMTAQCCVHLPNGVRVEFWSPLSETAIRGILLSASGLR